MAEFRTQLPKKSYPFKIGHQHASLCVGSCFAENIGQRLRKNKFNCILNPFGILYNPVSISEGIHHLLNNQAFSDEDLFNHQGLWHSFQHHGRFSGPDKTIVLNQINKELDTAHQFLQKTNRLIITLGTASVFQNIKTNKVVANCHKLPGNQFNKQRLSVNDCVLTLSQTFETLKSTQANLEILITVSPIRHLRDGLVENQRSKATLLLAVAELEQQFSFVHYFPAYEIMMDDLRDYRFYESDYTHPTTQAVDYIWDYFQHAFFTKETYLILAEISKILQAAQHRPFHVESEEHQTFLQRQIAVIASLEERYDFLVFSKERDVFLKQIC